MMKPKMKKRKTKNMKQKKMQYQRNDVAVVINVL